MYCSYILLLVHCVKIYYVWALKQQSDINKFSEYPNLIINFLLKFHWNLLNLLNVQKWRNHRPAILDPTRALKKCQVGHFYKLWLHSWSVSQWITSFYKSVNSGPKNWQFSSKQYDGNTNYYHLCNLLWVKLPWK